MSGKVENSHSPAPIDPTGLGPLAEPIRLLIEKVSDAVGGVVHPWQTRRVAEANADARRTEAKGEADAQMILALANLRITEVQLRAAKRLLNEEVVRQLNIESITQAALPHVRSDAEPQKIDHDWLVNFFDKSRRTSDVEMQRVWARILAGEANEPGSFSKRTVGIVADLEKRDAEDFQNLARFAWSGPFGVRPILIDFDFPVYSQGGVSMQSLLNLESLGLISVAIGAHFTFPIKAPSKVRSKSIICEYFGRRVKIVPLSSTQFLDIGSVDFSQSGRELLSLMKSSPVDGIWEHVTKCWLRDCADVRPIE